MGKFKIGQYVRRVNGKSFTTESGRHEEGFVGQIKEVVAKGWDELIFTNGHRGIADGYESWQPKVGDRVTTNGDTVVNIEKHWNDHFRRSCGNIVDGALVVASVANHGGSNVGLSNKVGRAYFFMPANALQPAAPIVAQVQPAALTIEAGKFYKMRDGRKVGPMERFDSGQGHWKAPRVGGFGPYWWDSGEFHIGEKNPFDLIAEWIDEPAVAVAASNDNAAKPTFKVGEFVKITHTDYPDHLPVGSIHKVVEADDDGFELQSRSGLLYFYHSEAEPVPTNPAIVALIENGQPRPSVKPYVHVDEASASKEAARLANKHKGQSFGVYVLTQTVTEEVTYTYKHEWQRLAANGEKISAIKALREITGFSLKATKDAVEYWIANDQQYSRIAA